MRACEPVARELALVSGQRCGVSKAQSLVFRTWDFPTLLYFLNKNSNFYSFLTWSPRVSMLLHASLDTDRRSFHRQDFSWVLLTAGFPPMIKHTNVQVCPAVPRVAFENFCEAVKCDVPVPQASSKAANISLEFAKKPPGVKLLGIPIKRISASTALFQTETHAGNGVGLPFTLYSTI